MQVLSLFSHRESRHSLGVSIWRACCIPVKATNYVGASLNEIYRADEEKKIFISPPSKIAHFYTNFHTKSNTILFISLKDNHIQLINEEKRRDDERKMNSLKQN